MTYVSTVNFENLPGHFNRTDASDHLPLQVKVSNHVIIDTNIKGSN